MDTNFFLENEHPYNYETTFDEINGRHVITHKWINTATGAVHTSKQDQLRNLFSMDEPLDEQLICQEVSAIFLQEGKLPARVILGENTYNDFVAQMIPVHRISHPILPKTEKKPEISALVTTVGTIKIVMNKNYENLRRYELSDGSVIKEL